MPSGPTRFELLRREDFLALEIELVNLALVGAPPKLIRETADSPAFVVIWFPPQHVLEEAFHQNADGAQQPGPVPVRGLLAQPTRLVFQLPDGIDSIEYSLESLIDWARLQPSLAPHALPPDAPSGPPLTAPGEFHTAIELPAALILSPDSSGRWMHRAGLVTHEGRTELWHTQLVPVGGEAVSHVRAIWFRSLDLPQAPPMLTALDDRDRREIVRLSSDFSMVRRPPQQFAHNPQLLLIWRDRMRSLGIPAAYVPRPIEAKRLMLTSLGGWASLHSAWDYPTLDPDLSEESGFPILSLEQWQHVATQGRDHYVRTVRKGFLCPTGHRASLVTISERQFKPDQIGTEPTPNGTVAIFGAIAYLRKYEFIVVQEPEKDYRGLAAAFAHMGREMPLRRVRIATRETPKLDSLPQGIFFPEINHTRFRFQIVAEDWKAREIRLELPLMFVPLNAALEGESTADFYNRVLQEYNTAPVLDRQADLEGQALAFAAATPSADTSLKTTTVVFKAQFVEAAQADALRPGSPRFLPELDSATVSIPAVDQLLGRSTPVSVKLDATYLDHEFDEGFNRGEVFVTATAPVGLAFAAQKAGGIARPDMAVAGVSRLLGPVANVNAAKTGTVDTNVFNAARLLGTVPLNNVLAIPPPFSRADFAITNLTPAELQGALDNRNVRIKVPVLKSTPIYPPGADPADLASVPAAIETRFVWKPELQEPPAQGILAFKTADAELILYGRTVTSIDGSESSAEVHGTLRRFGIEFVDAMTVTFDRLMFSAQEGKKLDVSADGFDMNFQGSLRFVNTIKSILPANGFSDPPFLSVTPDGVTAGYTLGVPTVGVGIFSLQNIALSAALTLPFVDKPAGVRFAISERHHPFLVTVTLFGGGGFFALALNANGIEQIEAAIEFGGSVCLNLGVASGGVEVMAGIYFSMSGDSVVLAGYLRCGGYLEVLGIISISVTFYIALAYRSKDRDKGEVWGQASVTVCVKIAFISKSVALSVERRFAGAAGDPTFDQLVSPDDWTEYCNAFA